MGELEEMTQSFDEALLRLRHEKTQLDYTMLTAGLKSASLTTTTDHLW